ncbi:MAG: insulinase family protein, partial [Anaerolineae bacterium]
MPSTIDPRLKKGERYRDFVVIKVNTIEELQCTLYELIHEPSSASIMHLANADSENLFCLSFQTLPKRSDGIAHILEHTVLCGSRKFPVKDPFFSMRRRSLNTFMNALTGADFTCYPAASQVEKDFYNLLDVYLDAVFHPQLKEQSFLQEGHRLEFAEAQNPKSALEHKGIVYNEMKGSLSSPDSRLWHEMMSHLVPDLPYTHNSGGDPRDIPSLTYADLIAFHETYYHPSRCLFFFYGNLPLKKHLDFIAENALKNVLKQPPLPPIPKQKRFSHPLYKETVYPTSEASDLSKKTMLAFGWLTMAVDDQEKVLALSLIDSILMNTDASLLKRPLLQSGLCMQVESYFDAEMSEVPYLIVFKGCEKNHSEKIQKLLFDTLKKIVEETIPLHLIETAIHQTEIARTEIVGDHAPFGLTLFMRSALAKQHGCSPENALMIHALFEDLLKRVKDPHYLGDLIQKILSDNPHFVRLTLLPDPTLTSKEHEQERKILDSIRERLTENDVQKLLAQAASLSAYQKQLEHQSLECLPKVSLDDVPQTSHDFLLRQEIFRNLHIFHHECFTNHFIYADLVFDLPFIAEEDLPYVQLFIALLAELGVGKRDFAANLDYVQAHTGGISASSGLYPQAQDSQLTRPALAIHGKALERKADKLLSLLAETAQLVRVDETARIEELLLQLRSAQQNRLSRNALRYAIQLATSSFSPSLHVSNMWSGLPYYKMIQELTEDPSSHL